MNDLLSVFYQKITKTMNNTSYFFNSFSNIPFLIGKNCWIEILLLLNLKDILSFSIVCKEFNSISKEEDLWKQLFLKTNYKKIFKMSNLNGSDYKNICLKGPFYKMSKNDKIKIEKNLAHRGEIKRKISQSYLHHNSTIYDDMFDEYKHTYRAVIIYSSDIFSSINIKPDNYEGYSLYLDDFTKCYLHIEKYNSNVFVNIYHHFILLIDGSDNNITFKILDDVIRNGDSNFSRLLIFLYKVEEEDLKKMIPRLSGHEKIFIKCQVIEDFSMPELSYYIIQFLMKSFIFSSLDFSVEMRQTWDNLVEDYEIWEKVLI